MKRFFLLLVIAGAFGCATQKSLRVADDQYKPTGGVYVATGSATFDDTSVRGTRVSMSKRADGTWGGYLGDYVLDLVAYPDHISSQNLQLYIAAEADGYTITGTVDNTTPVTFEVKADHFRVRSPTHGYTLNATGPGLYGPGGEVRLTGNAAQATPTSQMALALLAVFLDHRVSNGGSGGQSQLPGAGGQPAGNVGK